MIDSKLPAGCEEAARRPPKSGVATATSTREAMALTPQIERATNYLAFCSPGWCDQLRLLDSTPVPCAASRETVRRSEFAGIAAYGYCRSLIRDQPSRRQAAPRATQAFAETTNGGAGSLSLQSSRNAVRRSGSRPATCAPDGATPSVNGPHQPSHVAC